MRRLEKCVDNQCYSATYRGISEILVNHRIIGNDFLGTIVLRLFISVRGTSCELELCPPSSEDEAALEAARAVFSSIDNIIATMPRTLTE